MLPTEPKQNVSIVFLLTVAGESWEEEKNKETILTNLFV